MRRFHDSDRTTAPPPLFLFYAPHVAHCPLQVPQSYLDQFDFMEDNDETMCRAQTANILRPDASLQPSYLCQKQYHAIVNLLDNILGTLVDQLKQHGMWNNTLMVVTSDNGGPTELAESGAMNYPLHCLKYSNWEGGVRATAFVSGGFLPADRRGKVIHDPIHVCDWYATLPALAGIDVFEEEEERDEQQKRQQQQQDTDLSVIPPIDAVNVLPLILGKGYSNDDKIGGQHGNHGDSAPPPPLPRRVKIPLSNHALIVGDYKLLWKEQGNIHRAGWTGRIYPNNQTGPTQIRDQQINCSSGCLFNVNTDPGKHENIVEKEPIRVQRMKHRLQSLQRGFFENNDRGIDSCPHGYDDGDDTLPCACWMAVNCYGRFLGPYQEVDISS